MQGREGELWKQMEAHAEWAKDKNEECTNEEQTKATLISPYLKLLGYDPHDPNHVRREVPAGGHKKERVDYVVYRDQEPKPEPWLVVEAKTLEVDLSRAQPQLNYYAMTTKPAQYGALTNGRVWRWYRKMANGHLEEPPFLEHDVFCPGKREVRWLAATLRGTEWNGKMLSQIADDESLQSRFETWFEKAKTDPPDWFLQALLKGTVLTDPDTGKAIGKATKRMVERARTAWQATVQARDAQILAQASPRLRAEEPVPEEKPPPREEERNTSRKRKYRWRKGAGAPWSYCPDGRAALREVARVLFRTAGVKALEEVWGSKLVPLKGKDGAPLKWNDDKNYEPIPGTTRAIRQNLRRPEQHRLMVGVMQRCEGLEIETEGGRAGRYQPKEEWPWRKVEEAS